MPDRRRHRGPHPRDADLFAPAELPELRRAASDFAWLLTRAYPAKAALKLVGDRYALAERQRSAVQRATVGEPVAAARRSREVGPEAVRGRTLWIDAYNVLLSVETALGGGIVLASNDGAFRDMASMKGHYKRVEETRVALDLLGVFLEEAGCGEVVWLLDRPISNSGRLKKLMLEIAQERGWPWTVELAASPDRELAARGEADDVVATADGWILDHELRWTSLARRVIERDVPSAWVIDLFGEV